VVGAGDGSTKSTHFYEDVLGLFGVSLEDAVYWGMPAPERVAEAGGCSPPGAPRMIAACRPNSHDRPDCLAAHVCMARAKPGDDFWSPPALPRVLRPVYLEIGVDAGRLSLARPPTRRSASIGGARGTRLRR
jgi:hypothetical protein